MTPWLNSTTTLLFAMTASTFIHAATQEDLVCVNSNTGDKEIVLNELITTGNSSYKYTEVKVIKNDTDIVPFELCMGSLPFKETGGVPNFGCVDLGVGNGIWYDDSTTTPLLDNNGPNSTYPTTYYNPTWITYQNTDVLVSGEGQMDSADGQIILREKANPKNVVDYLCYSNSDICKDGISPYYKSPTRLVDTSIDPTDPDSVCWNEFVVGANSTKVFGRLDPDGTGAFIELPTSDPTTGNSNDGIPPIADQIAAVCLAIDSGTFVPVYSNSLLSLLNAAPVTITNESGTQNSFSTAGNYSNGASITVQAQYQYGKYVPPQDIPNYSGPANSVNNDVTLSSTSTLGPESYDVVTVTAGSSTGTAGVSGSIYEINSLSLGSNSQLNLVAGTYHIGELILGENAIIDITSGPVTLIIGTSLELSSGSQFMNSASDPGKLTIYLSSGNLISSENSEITGTIITAAGTTATFTDNASLHGSIFGLGKVAFTNSSGPVNVNYSANAIKAQRNLYGCTTTPPSVTTVTVTPSTAVSALTCQPQPVTLNVTKADGTAYVGTLNLTSSPAMGNWLNSAQTLISGNGTLNDGAATVAFVAGDAGIKNLWLSNTTTGGLTVTATDSVTSSITANSGTITFSDAGFIWLDTAGTPISPTNPLTLVSGTSTDVRIRAVKTDPVAGVCTNVFGVSASVPFEFNTQCVDPGTCAANQRVQITNNAIATDIGNPQNTPSPTNKNILFGANSTATLGIVSPDVGAMNLVARYPGSSNAPAMVGDVPFVSKPASLHVVDITAGGVANPGTSSLTDPVFTKAGALFLVEIESRNSLGAVTPNFGQEDETPQPNLSHALVAPAAGILGTLVKTGNWIAGTAGSGHVKFNSATSGLTYSEVGSITLTPSLTNYVANALSAGAVSGVVSGTIGRFTPDHFGVSTNTPVLSLACPMLYRGQDLTFSTAPTLTISALNTFGVITQNYDGVFFGLPATVSTDAVTVTQQSGAAWTPSMNWTGQWQQTTGYDGVVSLQLDTFNLGRNSLPTAGEGPISNPTLRIGLPDNPASGGASLIHDVDNVCYDTGAGCSDVFWDLGLTLDWLYGRAVMSNNNGSETEPLTMPISIEYWDGASWQTNLEDDSCTTLALTDFSVGSATGALATSPPTTTNLIPFTDGQGSVDLTAPGAGNTGSVVLTGNVPPWLQFAWDGTTLSSPSATAMFGIYRGRPPILFRSQTYR